MEKWSAHSCLGWLSSRENTREPPEDNERLRTYVLLGVPDEFRPDVIFAPPSWATVSAALSGGSCAASFHLICCEMSSGRHQCALPVRGVHCEPRKGKGRGTVSQSHCVPQLIVAACLLGLAKALRGAPRDNVARGGI